MTLCLDRIMVFEHCLHGPLSLIDLHLGRGLLQGPTCGGVLMGDEPLYLHCPLSLLHLHLHHVLRRVQVPRL